MGAFIDNEVIGSKHALPYSHAAGYEACERTDLVALSDLRPDVMEQAGKRYNVSKEHQYTDYKEMLAKEQPEIVSVATQHEQRGEIVIYAVDHGARAIFAEKAMAASMPEADAMLEACERNCVFFNLGVNRRYDPGYDKMKEVIDSGELGALKSLIIYATGGLFGGASHHLDLMMRLNSDCPAKWVRAHLPDGDEAIVDGRLVKDPTGDGVIQFENGVRAYALNTPRSAEYEAICERGVVTALLNGGEWSLRRAGPPDHRGRSSLVQGKFPHFEPGSSCLVLINDLVHSLDTGEPGRCGVRIARASTELIFAFVESHMRGGQRVDLPLIGSTIRLERDVAPRQPMYNP